MSWVSTSKTSIPERARWRTSSSTWSARAAPQPHELVRSGVHLPLRAGALVSYAGAEPDVAGDFHVAVFCRVWFRDWRTHDANRRRELRRLHRSGADHVVDPDRERRQRL